MTNGVKISELNSAASLDGTETMPVVQAGATVKATADQIKALAQTDVPAANITGTLPVAHGGTGATTAVDAVVNLSAEYVVADLAALKALTSRPTQVQVQTGQAAGTWRWSAGSSTTANDGTVVQCTAGTAGRYFRLYEGPINVKWFGAQGDGSTDDTTAIQAAIAWVTAVGRGTVYLPTGAYKITSTVTISSDNISLKGDGPGASYIYVTQLTTDGVKFTTSGTNQNGCSVSNLGFYHIGTDPTAGALLHWDRHYNFAMSDVSLFNGFYCLHFESAVHGNMSNVNAQSDGAFTSLKVASAIAVFTKNASGALCGELHFSNCDWRGQQTNYYLDRVVSVAACDGIFFTSCHFGMARHGVYLNPATNTTQVTAVNIDQCYLDTCSLYGFLAYEPSTSYTGIFGDHYLDFAQIYNCNVGIGWNCATTDWNTIRGGQWFDITTNAVSLAKGSRVSIHGADITKVNQGGAGGNGIDIDQFTLFRIADVSVARDGGTNAPGYGIYIRSGASDFVITGFRAKGCGTSLSDNSGSVTKQIDPYLSDSAVVGTWAVANGGTGAITANDAINNLFGGYTGTGDAVRKTSPTLTTPNIGAATAQSLTVDNTTTTGDALYANSVSTIAGTTTTFSWGFAHVNIAESIDQSGAGVGSTLNGLLVNHAGYSGYGARNGILAIYSHNSTTTTPAGRDFYTGVFSNVAVNSGDGGGSGTEKGAFFGYGGLLSIGSSAQHLQGVVGAEFDVTMASGSSTNEKMILQLVNVNGDVVKGTGTDAMAVFTGDGANPGFHAVTGFDYGIVFGKPNCQWPISSTGTIIGTYGSLLSGACPGGGTYNPKSAAWGIDFSTVSFSGGFLKSTGFTVDGSGGVTGASLAATGAITGGSTATLTNSFASYALLQSAGGTGFRWALANNGTLTLQRTTDGFSTASSPIVVGTGGGVTLESALTYGGVTLANSVTGTGNMVLSTSPSLTTPTLGVASATSVNKVAITAPATSATLTIADGKTLTASNTITFTATDGSTLAIGGGGTLGSAAYKSTGTSGNTVPLLDGSNTWSAGQTFSSALTYGGVTLSNSVTGTGSMVLSASPTISGTATFSSRVDVTGGNLGVTNSYGNLYALQAAGGTGFRWTLNNDGTFILQRTTDGFSSASNPLVVGTGGGVTFNSAMTYGGVTLSNSVTGTGSMVLSSAPTFTGTPIINQSGASLPSAISGAVFQLGGTASGTAIGLEGIAAGSNINARRTNGSIASPSAVQSADQLLILSASGYGATGYSSGNRGVIDILASENWTDSAQGTDIRFRATPTGSTTLTEYARIVGGTGLKMAGGAKLLLGSTYTAGAPAATGYVTIEDQTGTTYKVLVST